MEPRPRSDPLRVNIVTLGCPKNLVDTEVIAGQLLTDGIQIVSDPTPADAVIINTCAFIDAAKQESIDTILQFAAVRDRTRRRQALIVAGCLSQRFSQTLAKALPEVDAFMGIDQIAKAGAILRTAVAHRLQKIRNPKSEIRNKSKIQNSESEFAIATAAPLVEVCRRPSYILDHTTPRLRLTPRHYAYVKIADGCDNCCSYCTIPLIRGRYRSRPVADILAEAKALLASGAKELNLIAQDTTYYGHDLAARRARAGAARPATICTLLRELDALPGEFWIRLLYTHPAHWSDELIRTIAECRKVVKYVDLPLQHINDTVLERMHRRVGRQQIAELLGRIRRGIPGVTLRTSFIVGFPGETREQFDELLGFVRAIRFERLGVFTYSREEGTLAAELPGQVPATVKRARADKLMRLQRQIAREIAESTVGRVMKVLVDGPVNPEQSQTFHAGSRGYGQLRSARPGKIENRKSKIENFVIARSQADAPEIDGVVFVRAPKRSLPIGEFVWVKVVGHTDYDLLAEPI